MFKVAAVAFAVVLLAHIIARLVHQRVLREMKPEQQVLRYSHGLWLVGFAGLIFFGWGYYNLYITQAQPQTNGVIWGMILIAILSLYTLIEGLFVKGYYDDQQVVLFSPWTGKKQQVWHEVENCRYNSIAMWYVFTFKNDKVLRLNSLLQHSSSLMETLKARGIDPFNADSD